MELELIKELAELRKENSTDTISRRGEILNMLKEMELNSSINSTQEVKHMDNTKGIIKAEEKEESLTEGLMIENTAKGFAVFRDYEKENIETTKLKRLVRND